jgi:TRAP-type C4-dicarboxylate transport system permease small subunit
MRTAVKCLNWLDQRLEFWLGFFLYAYLAGIIVVEVFRRYVLNAASTWGEETAIYVFIWLSYIAAAKGVRSRRHLAVDTLRDRMPRIGQFCAYVLSDLCFFTLAAIVVYYSLSPIGLNIKYDQRMPGADIPMAFATAAVSFGWSLIAIRVVQRFVDLVKRFSAGKPLVDPVALGEVVKD